MCFLFHIAKVSPLCVCVCVWGISAWPVSWTRVNTVSPLACAASLKNPCSPGVADRAHFNHRAASSDLPGDGSRLHGYNFLPGVQGEGKWVCRDWGVSGMGPRRLERRCLSLKLPRRTLNYTSAAFTSESYVSSLVSAQLKFFAFSLSLGGENLRGDLVLVTPKKRESLSGHLGPTCGVRTTLWYLYSFPIWLNPLNHELVAWFYLVVSTIRLVTLKKKLVH